MKESGKKAYAIGYALFRIGSKSGNAALKDILERQALALIDSATSGNDPATERSAKTIEMTVRFAGDVGILHPANAETIIAELRGFGPAIAGSKNPAKLEPVSLEDIFPDRALQIEDESLNQHAEPEAAKSGIRQSAILDLIRQSGNCRMKEILEVLPNASERTIRYDLQSLVEQNLVEKVGNGGPSVFYRIRA